MTAKTPTKRTPPPTVPKELTLRRLIRAPRERVFRAWSTPEALTAWWGPDGFTAPRCEIDFRAGGALRIDMADPEGTLYPMRGEFREVVPPERIVFAARPIDRHGKPLFEVLHTVTLTESPEGTTVEVHAQVLSEGTDAAPYLQGMEAGWTQQLRRLGGFVLAEAAA
jgi:uncharacterized protein YndB with AHSA1/START domain